MDFMSQITLFISELLILIDNGQSISISEIENAADNNSVFELIKDTYGFKNMNSKPVNQDFVKDLLNNELYISEQEASKLEIKNNGLVYLVHLLTDKLNSVAHDYKWNYEDNLN